MNHEDYNAETICRAVGLGRFIDPAWSKSGASAVRIILTPSFHPEVIVTTIKNESGIWGSVVVAKTQIWSAYPQPIEVVSDEFCLDESNFLKLVVQANAALAEAKIGKKCLCLDGMGIEACFLLNAETEVIKAHVSQNKSARQFVAELTNLSWTHCNCAEVKNGLADVAGYVSGPFPRVQPFGLPSKPRANVLVLGTPEERSEFFERIQGHGKRPSS